MNTTIFVITDNHSFTPQYFGIDFAIENTVCFSFLFVTTGAGSLSLLVIF